AAQVGLRARRLGRRDGGRAVRPPGRGPRVRALGRRGAARRQCAHTGSRRVSPAGRPGTGHRLRRPRDELPHVGVRAGVRQRGPADARRRHEGEQPEAAAARLAPLPAHGQPGHPARLRRAVARAPRTGARPRAGAARLPCRPVPRLPTPMKLLLVTLYFPPAGGGGQRPLKFATYLPALGIETHVLAPDDPKWVYEDAELPLPTQAWVHRARYVGPGGRRIADELHGRTGVDLLLRRSTTIGRRLLLPDENVTWNATAIPKAISIVRREGIDVVLTTSPPGSVHLIGAAVQQATGAKWVADLRDS